jgi:glyoxylase-like metal-dependent hydrolase (beta-lactamase superfamily II)
MKKFPAYPKSNLKRSSVDKNRRTLLNALGISGLTMPLLPVLGSIALPVQAQSGNLSAASLGNNLNLISGAGSNVLVKKAGNGELIVVDGGLKTHARDLRNFIRNQMDSRRFHTLINTHWHEEQTGLNELLAGDVRIFAHENTRLWLSTDIKRPWEDFVHEPLPEKARPDETYYHYGDFTVDDTTVLYGYMLQAHTDGDSYVWFTDDNVLHAGGVLSNDGWPLMDWWTGGWIGGLVDGIETILRVANADTIIVPANGPVLTYAEVEVMHEMYSTIYQRIRQLFQDARGPQETIEAKPTEEFDALMGNPDQFVLLSHQSVLPHLAPDA